MRASEILADRDAARACLRGQADARAMDFDEAISARHPCATAARHACFHVLAATGWSAGRIARSLGFHRRTVEHALTKPVGSIPYEVKRDEKIEVDQRWRSVVGRVIRVTEVLTLRVEVEWADGSVHVLSKDSLRRNYRRVEAGRE